MGGRLGIEAVWGGGVRGAELPFHPERNKERLENWNGLTWPDLAGGRMKLQWRWKLQRVFSTANLCSGLSSCFLRCTPAADEDDYDVINSNDSIHSTFKKRTGSNL